VVGGYGSSIDHGDDARFLTKIDASEWLHHSRRILAASVTVAEKLELERASVLVHCRSKIPSPPFFCSSSEFS
jgi:hypothetical protein